MYYLGVRVACQDLPGKEGTIVHINGASGMWRSDAPTFDIVWDDLSCTRAVPRATIEGPGWNFLAGRKPQNECNRIWYDYQIHRSKQMAAKAALRAAGATEPSLLARLPHADRRESTLSAVQPSLAGLADSMQGHERSNARESTAACRALLASAFSETDFAVSCERRVLTVAWMDGPLDGSAWRALSKLQDDKVVDRIRLKRSLTERHIQAAIDYCVWRVYGDDLTHPDACHECMRLTPTNYQSLDLESVSPRASSRISGVSYQSLIRCVLDRWDDSRKQFLKTRSTVALVQQQAVLFPDGDAAAREDFLMIQRAVADRHVGSKVAVRQLREQSMRAA